jgi:hypothetical protein
MPALLEGLDDGAEQRVVLTVGQRMGMDDLDQHLSAPLQLPP